MEKEELIRQCRYYKGQQENPFKDNNLAWFWDMERVFVHHGGVFTGEADVYHAINGKEYSGIPHDLLMVMFTSWGKYAYDVKESLPKFYERIDEYLDFVSDEIPRDKIPC